MALNKISGRFTEPSISELLTSIEYTFREALISKEPTKF
jgi:hypothetical protein